MNTQSYPTEPPRAARCADIEDAKNGNSPSRKNIEWEWAQTPCRDSPQSADPSGHAVSPKCLRGGFNDMRWMTVLPTFVGGLQGSERSRILCVPHPPHLQQKCRLLCWSEPCELCTLIGLTNLHGAISHCTAHFGNLCCRHVRQLYFVLTLPTLTVECRVVARTCARLF